MGEIKDTKRVGEGGNGVRVDAGVRTINLMDWFGVFFSLPVKETQSSITIELKQIVINDAQESLASASGQTILMTGSQQAVSNVFNKRVYAIKPN